MAKFESFEFQTKSGHKILFRNIESKDAEKLLNFRRQIALDSTNTMQYVGQELPSIEETSKRLNTQLEDRATINVGAFDGENLVGYLNFRMPWVDHPWVTHLGQFGMMILKSYWGFGLGKKMLQIQEAHAKSIGVSRIEAMVRTVNDRGITLYKRAGYTIEGTRKKAALIDNEFVDEYFIAKILNDPLENWKPQTLETARLILRPIELSDASAIFEYASNPAVSQYTLWEPHRTIQDSVDYIKDYVFRYYAQGVPEPLGMALKSNPEKIIGTVGCFWVSKSAKSMELAYAIAKEHWGQGLVAEASQAVMNFCFKNFELKRIQARCKTENLASARVMEKVGMTFEGTLRSTIFHRERHWGMHYYAKVV